MQTIVKRTQRDYSLAFKLSVVDHVEKGEMTYMQAQDRYGIQGRSTVLVWLRKHGKLDWSQGAPLPQGVQPMSDPLPLPPEPGGQQQEGRNRLPNIAVLPVCQHQPASLLQATQASTGAP